MSIVLDACNVAMVSVSHLYACELIVIVWYFHIIHEYMKCTIVASPPVLRSQREHNIRTGSVYGPRQHAIRKSVWEDFLTRPWLFSLPSAGLNENNTHDYN